MINKTNALIISNNEEDFSVLKNIISKFKYKQYKLDWIQISPDQKLYISSIKYDICFIDYSLKNKQVIQEIINNNDTIPFILLIEKEEIEINTKIKRTISDFLVKRIITTDILEKSIHYSIEIMKSSNKIKLLDSKLEKKVKKRTEILDGIIEKLEKTKLDLEFELAKEKKIKTNKCYCNIM